MECYGASCCGNYQTLEEFDPPVPLDEPPVKGAVAVSPTGGAGGGAASKPPPGGSGCLSLAQRDAALRKLGLPPNAELQEGLALTPEEATAFVEVKAKLPPSCCDNYDETAQQRILRGMFTNNKGTRAERIGETVGTFERVFKWKQENGLLENAFARSSSVAPSVFRHWPTVIGGEDHYGHVVWTETLGDVSALVDAGVKEQQVLDVRAQICEAVERLKAESAARLGQRRYKQARRRGAAARSRSRALPLFSGAGDATRRRAGGGRGDGLPRARAETRAISRSRARFFRARRRCTCSTSRRRT